MYVSHVGHFNQKITKLVLVGNHYELSIKLLKALCTMQSNVGNLIVVVSSNTIKRLITGLRA